MHFSLLKYFITFWRIIQYINHTNLNNASSMITLFSFFLMFNFSVFLISTFTVFYKNIESITINTYIFSCIIINIFSVCTILFLFVRTFFFASSPFSSSSSWLFDKIFNIDWAIPSTLSSSNVYTNSK